jgi:glyoxylase-like metal-dependent hydrolase (beta-lactamase superfamily II)
LLSALFTSVDTGFGVEATWALWERHLAGVMGARAVKNIVVTHYHPDHVGSAAWLVDRTGAPMWMTATEFLSAHAAHDDTAGFDRATGVAVEQDEQDRDRDVDQQTHGQGAGPAGIEGFASGRAVAHRSPWVMVALGASPTRRIL